MNCKYSYYDGEKDSFNMQSLYCNISNQLCYAIRRCSTVGRIINIDGYINCTIKKERDTTMGMTQDKPNRVLFEKRGMLAVETNDEIGQVVMVENTFKEIPQWVKLFKKDGKYYAK